MTPEHDEGAYMEARYKVSDEELIARTNAVSEMGGATFVKLNGLDKLVREGGSPDEGLQNSTRKNQTRSVFMLALLCGVVVTTIMLAVGVALEWRFK